MIHFHKFSVPFFPMQIQIVPLLASALLLWRASLCSEHRINSASDLIAFSESVCSGTSFEGTTVFLDADIDFSGGLSDKFKPIGKSINSDFCGTFDGQGYTVNNLIMNVSQYNTGLFGYSSRATIRNIVLDDSCSVVNFYSVSTSEDVTTGGFFGKCQAKGGSCIIEGCVNMANITFSGYLTGKLSTTNIGGIIGELISAEAESHIANCANYGQLSHPGKSK